MLGVRRMEVLRRLAQTLPQRLCACGVVARGGEKGSW
jgi:hypothetical protein